MTPFYSDGRATVYVGDCRDVLPHLAPADTCLTDPPYGLGFMGKGWDRGVPGVEFWEAAAGAVKPGASLLAFGGTRTFHRLTCAIEGAGWEIRDCLMWLYGTGFPKSLDVSKALDRAAGAEREVVGVRPTYPDGTRGGRPRPQAERVATGLGSSFTNGGGLTDVTAPATDAAREWVGYGTALKPAYEPIILAMRPLDGTFAENALRHGVAGLNIDGARIGGTVETWPTSRAYSRHDTGSPNKATQDAGDAPAGRWPANLLLDEDAAELLDEQAGLLTSGGTPPGGVRTSSPTYNAHNGVRSGSWPADHGLASRFFYCSKASRAERGDGNNHPTVKPLDLLRYLCRLTATPTGGTVLDPFMGSGSTLIAAIREGRRAIGIELSEEYAEIAVRRIQAEPLALDFGGVA